MAIFTQYGSRVEIISETEDLGAVQVLRHVDGARMVFPLLYLKADGGMAEILEAIKSLRD